LKKKPCFKFKVKKEYRRWYHIKDENALLAKFNFNAK